MGKENGKGIVEWLTTKLGLYNERIDIHKELDDRHATLVECEAMWGKEKTIMASSMKFSQTEK